MTAQAFIDTSDRGAIVGYLAGLDEGALRDAGRQMEAWILNSFDAPSLRRLILQQAETGVVAWKDQTAAEVRDYLQQVWDEHHEVRGEEL